MTLQQWAHVMRKAGCQIYYVSREWYKGVMWYQAVNSRGDLLGIWDPIYNAGTVIIGGNVVMSWDFTQ